MHPTEKSAGSSTPPQRIADISSDTAGVPQKSIQDHHPHPIHQIHRTSWGSQETNASYRWPWLWLVSLLWSSWTSQAQAWETPGCCKQIVDAMINFHQLRNRTTFPVSKLFYGAWRPHQTSAAPFQAWIPSLDDSCGEWSRTEISLVFWADSAEEAYRHIVQLTSFTIVILRCSNIFSKSESQNYQ